MVGPISFQGLFSGIDYNSIIEKLLSAQQKSITQLQSKIDSSTEKKNALLEVNTSLLAFKGAADALARPSVWGTTQVSSTHESILSASGGAVGALGGYSFAVRRLAQSHQMISNGFPDAATTSVTASAGTLRIELGGGYLDRRTPVSFLNGQTGYDRGSIKVTDSAGRVAVIDLEGAVTVQDVLDELNRATSVAIRASVAGNRLVVQDRAGGAGTLTIENYGDDTTATSLGIAGTSVTVGAGKYVFGTDINTVGGSTKLAFLNDGLGVRRNGDGAADFTVTDTDGVSFGVDLKAADDTLQKVVDRINQSATDAGSSLRASLSTGGNALVLDDDAGISAVGVALSSGSFAAVDLGLGIVSGAAFVQNAAERSATGVEDAAGGNRLVGSTLAPELNSTLRNLLNGGMTNLLASDLKGVSDGTILITDRRGNAVSIDLSRRSATTTSTAGGPGLTSLDLSDVSGFAVGNRFRVQTTVGIEYRTVTDISGNTVSFDSPLEGSLSGGEGVYALNDSLEDILRLVNGRATAAGVGVRAELNRESNGLRIIDTTGAAVSPLKVEDVSGNAAADLGIAGSVSAASIDGGDLDPQYLGEATALASMNAGQGVAAGRFRVIDTRGLQFDVDLTQSDDTTLGEVIKEINYAAAAAGSGVTARIGDGGDGLILEDGTPGNGTLRVQELGNGKTARDLNIASSGTTAAPAVIDGSFEVSISVKAGSTLQDVAAAINARGIGVTASVINDGSSINPCKLALSSRTSGEPGRMTVDSSIDGLSFSTTAAAQNAILLYGANGGSTDPTVVTAAQNTLTGIVPGLTLQLKGTSASPVTVTVSRDLGAITDQAQRFVDTYNETIKKIKEYTYFNADTFTTGVLFSDPAIRRVQRELSSLIVNPVGDISASDLNNLASVGIKVSGEGALTFDSSRFREKLESGFDKVQSLFTLQRKLQLGTLSRDLNNGRGLTDTMGDDFVVRARNGVTSFNVDVGGATTIGSILQKINNAVGNGGVIQAQLSADGFSIEFVDNSVIATRGIDAVVDASSFTEGDLAGLANGALVGAFVTFLSGANTGEVRKITGYDAATGKITLDSAPPAALAAGDSYKIERETEVRDLGVSTAATELKIAKKLALGQNLLKGGILNLNRDPGVGSRIGERLDYITRSGDGLISTRTDTLDDTIKGFSESIEKINKRLEKEEERLVRQFTRLEQAIAESQNTMQRLQSMLQGLSTGTTGS